MPGAVKETTMKILVIDDTQAQLDHAKNVLADYEVTIAGSWREGKEALEMGGWDLVLTDLSMPAEGDGQGPDGRKYVGQPTPYGFPLALLALKLGIPKVAIVSNGQGDDGNHHDHPIFWASDNLHGEIVPERLWAFTGYECPHMDEKSMPGVEKSYLIKDWATVVKTVTA